ncbi:hypothetical protein CHLRE_07g331600v5 [Chlamydomonas reinhardtii]|uniref:Uncharacterized protein n=1 Tax=Chlamydomonas reinhardtii TaxID=3055 RepID=A0A2K3DJX5_CHLRE|nr:uncharacterized protein CHLRE_07g331600v5 [Chlamydomonas reinhardtii]PNW80837.1 hypothetical protein CHLRE_07g331600v5 [Chlamydomonas reinhardtii]
MNPENRAKSRYYMFLAQLLAEIRHGTLLLCAADFEELEELEEQPEDTLADAGQLDPGFEEEVEGDVEEEGPMELVMLRAPEGGSGVRARNRALSHGLQAGMQAGCEAALLVEVKALVGSHHMWQALSAGIALARRNTACGSSGGGNGGDGSGGGGSSSGGGGSRSGGGSYPGSPVHVVLTDARDWHFMGIQATAAAATKQPAGGAGGVAAAAAAGSSASGASGGLDYTLKSGESFRLFNCSSVYAPVLVRGTEAARMVEVMYRLYTALYPDEDLGRLPDLLDRGDIQAKEAAREWLVQRTEKLERARPPADYAGLVARVAQLEAEVQALRERGGPGAAGAGAAGGGST